MKVFVVMYTGKWSVSGDEKKWCGGVFSTEEKAERYAEEEQLENPLISYWEVEEFAVDNLF